MTPKAQPEIMAEFELTLSAERVAKFFQAVAWSSPYKPATPPTIATCFREGEFKALEKLGVPLQNVLHGEQTYRYLKPLAAHETYKGITKLMQQHEKSGGSGKLTFLIFQTDIVNSHGEKCLESLTTIIARGMP